MMRGLGDPDDFRGLLNLPGEQKLEDDDWALAELVQGFDTRSQKEKLKISQLVNHVAAFKIKEKEEAQKRDKAEQYRDAIQDPRIRALRAHLDASGAGASSVPKGIRQEHKYPAILQESDWSNLQKGQDSLVHVKLAILIPMGLWDNPQDAIIRGDEFMLHRIRTIPTTFEPTELRVSPKAEKSGHEKDKVEPPAGDIQAAASSSSEAFKPLSNLVNLSLREQAGMSEHEYGQGT